MPKSEFFTPVRFPKTRSPADNRPKTKVVWDEDLLKEAEKSILLECAKIRVGTSKMVAGAIDNGRFGLPAENAIKVFLADPSDDTFAGIKDISRQDFGQLAGDYFVELLLKARKVIRNE